MSPTAPLRFCLAPGCAARVTSGHCPAHAALRRTQVRRFQKGATSYSSRSWRRLREQKLARDPMCEDCQKAGRTRAGSVVDHRERHCGDVSKFLVSLDELRTLCEHCHNRRTADQTWHGGRKP